MKALLKIISSVLGLLIFAQSCAVYEGNYTLGQAAIANQKTKLTTLSERTYKYDRIDALDGQYFGIKQKKDDVKKEAINESEINLVQLYDREASKKNTTSYVGVFVGIGLLALIIGAASSGLNNLDVMGSN